MLSFAPHVQAQIKLGYSQETLLEDNRDLLWRTG
jgi:hypothetical protein